MESNLYLVGNGMGWVGWERGENQVCDDYNSCGLAVVQATSRRTQSVMTQHKPTR